MKKKWFFKNHSYLFNNCRKIVKIMRLSIFLIILTSFQSIALNNFAQGQKFNVEVENETLSNVLKLIEKESGYFLFYNNKVINLEDVVSINMKNTTVTEVLNELFKGTNITYNIIRNKQIVFSKKSSENQQQVSISGKVTDSTGSPLPGVSIVVKGTTNGTTTNVDGSYSLTNIPTNAVLQFSFVGMKMQEIAVTGKTNIDVMMEEDAIGIEEVVAVGYGTMKKSDLTGSIGSFKSNQLEQQGNKVNVLQALQGAVPGLNIQQTSNDAAQDSYNIIIRGQNSIKASNTPLIILDGVPYEGSLNEIDQGDIESIEVLKDASSAAIYGARGANGVILITTKKGNIGKTRIRYEGSYGVQEIYKLPSVLNGDEYWDFAVDRVGQDVVNQFPTLVENHANGKSVDWLELGTRNGQQQKHSVKLSGGLENIQYYISGTYSNVKGISLGDDFQEWVVRSNLTVHVNEWIKIGTNSQYSDQDLSGVAVQFSGSSGVYRNNPLINPFDEDGSYSIYPWPEETNTSNPLLNLNIQDEDYAQRLFSNNYAEIKFPFCKGLSYKFNTGYTRYNRQIGRFWGSNTRTGVENNGQSYTYNNTNQDVLIENILSFQKAIGKHSINFTGLYSAQKTTSETRYLTAKEFPTDVLTWYQPDVAATLIPGADYSEKEYISQMIRLSYSFNSKYLLTVTARRDGYSGFGEDNKFGIFPSAALGWNISNEKFLSEVDWLTNLKLRLSYGQNGNQAIAPYETMAKLTALSYLQGDNANETAPGYYSSSLANPNLSWETSQTANMGIDFQLFKSRIIGAVDFYKTKTKDLLLDRLISSTHGITSITQNIGRTENRGIELSVRSINVQKSNLQWDTEFNFSFNDNKIIDLYGDKTDDVANGWFIGKPIGTNYGYIFNGVWQTNEDNSLQPDAKPGDIKVKDTDKSGDINSDDRGFMGQSSPKYIIGLTNTIKYKNLTFSFFLYSPRGATKYNPLWDTDIVMADARYNTIKLDWWREDNPSNYPANRSDANPYGIVFYQDASYVRLRDVTLSYLLPKQLSNKIGLNNLRIYGNIKNGLTFTKWKGVDPELSEQRDIPLDRTFIIGISMDL